uniref:Uncharacterized protein n=1 Tax=Arundo donax TaxID=35708 RepID=A0A0A9CBP5_ARUDO
MLHIGSWFDHLRCSKVSFSSPLFSSWAKTNVPKA